VDLSIETAAPNRIGSKSHIPTISERRLVMNRIGGVGIAWYRKEDYERVRAISDDVHTFPDTFEDWEKRAEERREEMLKLGHVVIKAYIDPDTFPTWCRANRYKVDSKGRMVFASAEAHRVTSHVHKD